MALIFSRSSAYAIQAILLLTDRPSATVIHARDISRELGIPLPFLSKILQKLAHDGILISHRGSTGGFALSRTARRVTLREIIQSVDGAGRADACLLGITSCADGDACALHFRRHSLKKTFEALFADQSLASLSRKRFSSHVLPRHHSGTNHGKHPSLGK